MERIALLAPHFHEYALRLGNALASRANVRLFIDTERLGREYQRRNMPVAPNLTIEPVSYRSILDIPRIAARVFGFRPSIVHIQEPSGLLRAVICSSVVATRRERGQLVLTVHDPDPHQGRDSEVARRIAFFRSYIRRRADAIVVHGAYCREQYLRIVDVAGQRIAASEHGVILNDGAPPADPPEVFRVIAFGRMEEYKGLAVLCAAIERLVEERASIEFRILGSGPELDRLLPRLRELRCVSVDNTFIPAARLIEEIASSDCVVMPYLNATQSGVLAAAFANGKFVVASRVGGIPDVVQSMENGILVPPGEPVALAAALKLAAGDRELRERLQAGARKTAAARLDWDRIADALWDTAYRK